MSDESDGWIVLPNQELINIFSLEPIDACIIMKKNNFVVAGVMLMAFFLQRLAQSQRIPLVVSLGLSNS